MTDDRWQMTRGDWLEVIGERWAKTAERLVGVMAGRNPTPRGLRRGWLYSDP
jgi:hypothetical protein